MSANADESQGNGEKSQQAVKLRILFVDDEEMVLRMLRAAMGAMPGEWDANYATSGEEALKMLENGAFDMVVSDMRMPGMNGAQLLNEVFRSYPATFRVILTGFVEQQRVMESVGTAHQFLAKPFELDRLRELLLRTASLRGRLRSQKVRAIVAKTGCVPSVSSVYFDILDALQAPDCPVERIAEIAATDPGLTSKILQLVNSAFFGFASQVSSANEAVMLLGTGTIRALALTCGLFSSFPVEHGRNHPIDQLWGHSLRVARSAERICRYERTNAALLEQSFTAGLLHDIGKLILAHSLAGPYLDMIRQSLKDNRRLSEIESAALGTNHAEVGAALLQLWGLPGPLVEGVLWHEQPSEAHTDGLCPVAVVHVANSLDHEATDSPGAAQGGLLDKAYLDRQGLSERVDLWRQHCTDQ